VGRIVVSWWTGKVLTSRPRAHASRHFFSVFRAVLARSTEILPQYRNENAVVGQIILAARALSISIFKCTVQNNTHCVHARVVKKRSRRSRSYRRPRSHALTHTPTRIVTFALIPVYFDTSNVFSFLHVLAQRILQQSSAFSREYRTSEVDQRN
jgi:hypothetical protein